MSLSTVTYTSVYTDSEPGRVFWGADEELSNGGSLRVIIYGYDGLPMQLVAPPSLDYVPGPEHPPSPNYVPGPEHPPSPVEPLPADASPTALSPGYVADSDPDKDPEEDHTYYPADGGDGDDNDDDTDDEDEEPFEDEDDDKEEEEHLAPTDSSTVPAVDPVPSAEDTEAFETDESAPTPRSPQTKVPFAQTRLCRARKTVRLEPPMSASMEARIVEHAAAPTPPLPVASPPLPLPSPLTTSPTDAGAPLGYRAAGIRMRVASPPLSRNGDDNHDSGTGERRQASTVRECTYTDFLKCQPMNFKGTEGVVGLTQWLEKMESVFHISNCTVACQVKFATCTLQGNTLTRWNSHVRAVGHDVAYAMPWKTLKKVKGTDVMSYNQLFQELVLMCDRMFPEESDVVEKYVGGLLDMIHGSVKASKPKMIQEAIEFASEMIDKKILTIAERRAKNKRKFDDTSRNNQN
ncbi:hypothetical protein Tco_0522216 [Tanacetum coccineum]